MNADFSEVTALAQDLAAAPERTRADVTRLIRRGVRTGRDRARELFRGQVRQLYLPHYAGAITHEVSGLSGEFGPESSRQQGGMGRGVEFGSMNHGPIAHMMPAADELERSLPDDMAELALKVVLQ